jgi:hypothetical protein
VRKRRPPNRALADVARNYKDRGFRVVTLPGPQQLPPFLKGHRPDLIAFGEDESVVVEVKAPSAVRHEVELSQLAAALEHRPGWRLELISTGEQRAPLPDQTVMRSSLRSEEIRALLEDAAMGLVRGHTLGAVLSTAVAAEGLLRRIARRYRLPRLGPETLAKTLYSEGPLLEHDAELLVNLFRLRNAILHGRKRVGDQVASEVSSALEAARRIQDAEDLRDRIDATLREEAHEEEVRAALIDAIREYQPERRFSLEAGGAESNSEVLEEIGLDQFSLGEIQDLEESSAAISVFARATLHFVFLIDNEYLSEVEDLNFQVQDHEAVEGLAMATTERTVQFEFSAWINFVTGEFDGGEVVDAETTDS